jgi:hypothetical protein
MYGTSSRRQFLRGIAGAAVAGGIARAADDALLDDLERRGCLYFYEMADPATGLVLDRALIDEPYKPGPSSIAATGFGLSALCIAGMRGYLTRDQCVTRIFRTLEFLNSDAPNVHGFFYHFADSATGKRVWNSEISSIDTGWLLCGVLHCRMYWPDDRIKRLASLLLDRVDWKWMLDGSQMLSHGWTPERGFLPYRWDSYAESLALYLLAIGAGNNGIPASSWDSWKRPMTDFSGVFYIDAETPLFVHQYSHAWFDFRDRRDRYANYFANSQRATQAHRQYCISLSSKFPWYGPDMWGVSASDSQGGYRVWGSPASPPDGTLVPCASGGSLGLLPTMCTRVLENMRSRYGDKVWRRYGFVDAFHPKAEWYSPYVIGIDQGIMLLMAENVRSGAVWDWVMSAPESSRAMTAVGLHEI